jgi:hypothetical protein
MGKLIYITIFNEQVVTVQSSSLTKRGKGRFYQQKFLKITLNPPFSKGGR